MYGAMQLVEQQQGKVAGLVAVVIEDCARTAEYRKKYPCISAIQPGTKWQDQANAQYLESFKTYKPEDAFPI